jgi:hypothetical protein
MKIIINGLKTGFGNNGGTRTLIKCGEHLSALGADVVAIGRSGYTWHKPKIKIVDCSKVPLCDIVIATGYRSVRSTLESKAIHKFYYVRGYELWQASESKLIESFRKLRILVNNEWQYRHMMKHGIDAKIVYPGIDDIFHNLGIKRDGIGAIYHQRHKTKRHVDAAEVAKRVGCKLVMLNKDCVNPKPKAHNKWYNSIKVWFAPTELEGLHNPPIEASLAGCALVCTDHERAGMSDYAIHGETALVYPARNLNVATRYVKRLLEDDKLRMRLNKNMCGLLFSKIRLRRENMSDLLKYFKSLK